MSYTLIPVMYRDGANYKSYGTIALEGEMTATQIEELRGYLCQEFGVPQYKPEMLGFEHQAYGEGGWNDDYDHDWHDMFLDELTVSPELSYNHARYLHEGGTVEKFLAKVKRAHERNWGE